LKPSICKKFRRIFKNAGYKVFLINEFRTSSPFQGFQSLIGSCFYKNNIFSINILIYLLNYILLNLCLLSLFHIGLIFLKLKHVLISSNDSNLKLDIGIV